LIAGRKILLIRPDHLGDVILSLPVAEALKNYWPDSRVYYFSAPGPANLQGMIDYVDGWIIDETSRGSKLSLFQLAKIFRMGGFDILVELKPSWRTAVAGFLSGSPIRIGTSRRFYSIFYNRYVNLHRRASGRHQTDLDLAMLKPLGINNAGMLPSLQLGEICREKAKTLLTGVTNPYIVIHPGGGGSTTNWPLENYRQLAKMILQRTEYAVIITGYNDKIGEFENCLNLNGKTDIESLAGVLAGASLFISVGTGPLHLADALGTRCMAFFTNRAGIEPERWGPRRNMENILVSPNKTCRCADSRSCRCLEQISSESAFNRVESILGIAGCGTAKK
jgi:ADP-heptose:LPS heptosyltransferase